MDIESVAEELARFGEDDWLGLWLIAAHVSDELGVEDPHQQLQITLVLVRELLKRGFRAGDSPAQNGGVHFTPWPNQDPDTLVEFIERQWTSNDEFPSWGDAPWFAASHFCRLDA